MALSLRDTRIEIFKFKVAPLVEHVPFANQLRCVGVSLASKDSAVVIEL